MARPYYDQSFMKNRSNEGWPPWDEYRTTILTRFGSGAFDDPVAELMKLRQLGSIEQYQETSDALPNRVKLPLNHAISCFLSRLNDEIQHTVRMFQPQTLHDAYFLAKLHEATLASISNRTKSILDRPPSHFRNITPAKHMNPLSRGHSAKRTSYSASQYSRGSSSNISNSIPSKPKHHGGLLIPKEIDEKRAKNLCFFCDEKYYPEHKCKAQVYRLEVLEEEEESTGHEGDLTKEVEDEETVTQLEAPHISIHALNGMNRYQTMKIAGKFRHHPLHILIV